jgi:hypothetical protein
VVKVMSSPSFLDKIDLVFVCDRSESMHGYNTVLQSQFKHVLQKLQKSTESQIRVSIVSYGAENAPVNNVAFTSDFEAAETAIGTIVEAKEALSSEKLPKKSIDNALVAVAALDYSPEATTKIVFFLLDSAPLGLTSEVTDDAVKAARTLLEKGVVLYLIADETRLGEYGFQPNWFGKAICELTGGSYVQLYDSAEVYKVVQYAVQEEVSLGQFEEEVRLGFEAVNEELKDETLEKKLQEVAKRLVSSGLKLPSFGIRRIDVEEEEERNAIKSFLECQDMNAVRELLPKLQAPKATTVIEDHSAAKMSSGTLRQKAKTTGKKNKKSVIEVLLTDDKLDELQPTVPTSPKDENAPQVPDFDLDEKQAASAYEKTRRKNNVIFKETGTSEAIYQKKKPITAVQVRRCINRNKQ